MKVTRISLVAATLLCLAAVLSAQAGNDVLYLQDGSERVGQLVQISAEQITFLVDGEDEPTLFPRATVQRVELTQQRLGDQAQSVDQLDDPVLKRVLEHQPPPFMYPDSGHVTLYSLTRYDLDESGGYTVRQRRIERVMLERGKARATVARTYKQGEQTLTVDFARTIDPDGTVTPMSDSALEVSSVFSEYPAYEKLYQAKFALKQIRIGSVIDYQVTIRRDEGNIFDVPLCEALFREEEPVLEAELVISAPLGHELLQHTSNLGDNVTTTREEGPQHVTIRFTATNCERVVREPQMPPASEILPHVAVSTQMTWSDIGTAASAALGSALDTNDEMRAYVAGLVADGATATERARAIYQDFNRTVRYLQVSPPLYSYEPRPASETFTARAGNSLDKAALLVALLQAADVDAALVLVCPQTSGVLLEDVPNVHQLVVAVVAADLPDGRVFLALNDETIRFGQLPYRFQNSRGLLVTPTSSELVDLPLNEPAQEQIAVRYEIDVSSAGDVTVKKTETYTGNDEIWQRNMWKDLQDEEIRRDLEVSLNAMHAKSQLDSYEIENLHDLAAPLRFVEQYTLTDYAIRGGDDLLVFQLPEIDYTAASVGKPARLFPMRWYRRGASTKTMHIRVPAGYRVHYAGQDYSASTPAASFTATFTTDGDVVTYEDAFVREGLEVMPAEYADYKACIETQARVAKEWIVLERVSDE